MVNIRSKKSNLLSHLKGRVNRYKFTSRLFTRVVGQAAVTSGITKASSMLDTIQSRIYFFVEWFFVAQGYVWYWKKNWWNPKTDQWGGARNWKFSTEVQREIETHLWIQATNDPSLSLAAHVSYLKSLGKTVSVSYVRRIFASWQ